MPNATAASICTSAVLWLKSSRKPLAENHVAKQPPTIRTNWAAALPKIFATVIQNLLRMQWLWRFKLCSCRFRAPPSIPTSNATPQTLLAEDNSNDWEVIFESSGHEAGVRSTSARPSQPARTRSQKNNLLDPHDPRRNAACWPCFGKHVVQRGSNKYGSWTKCARCSVRLSYQSKENSSSSQSEDEVQFIAAALARLRRTRSSDEISADDVNAMIRIIQGERALTANPSQ